MNSSGHPKTKTRRTDSTAGCVMTKMLHWTLRDADDDEAGDVAAVVGGDDGAGLWF